jgi:glucose/arabinose dehydrogenase
MRNGVFVLLASLLAACGGGSGGNNNIGVAGVVPDVVNQTQAAASAAISAAGLRVGGVTTLGSGTIVAGNVISQDPVAGTSLPAGSNVNLVVSSGPLPAFGLVQPFPNLADFDKPIFLAAVPAPDTRLVVVEQTGKVRVFASNASVTTTSTILDVSALITTAGSEQGLLGFAFDPDFASNHFIYVDYTQSDPADVGATVVARYTWDPSTPTATSPKIILTVSQPASNHNGGMIAFGMDDYLYVGLGDGGSDPSNGQNLNSLLGSILRLDVHPANDATPYNIPADNPFVGQPNHKEEIWAFGFRNPFRFSFDRDNGELWAGDVGQNNWEEIDIVESGKNYGWPAFEGNHTYSNVSLGDGIAATPPLYEYDHSLGCAIIGGYVYRGSRLVSLFSRYLYTDYCSGTVWSLDNTGQDNTTLATAPSPTSFGEDNAGELYVVAQNGRIYQLQ